MKRWITNNAVEEATANPGEHRNTGTQAHRFTVTIETTDTRHGTGARLFSDLVREMQLRFGSAVRVEWDA